ncbi:RNA polymerase sigma factor [Arthrobacter sp. NPDC090010]|uniref:RNA polymerase sigma factor n=1 Tax=Arthrobacter sp. NPDC090010 TaxID=3363942 RepID=UPI00380518EB
MSQGPPESLIPWVGRAQEGDPEAFEQLVIRLTGPLRSFARGMLGHWAEAEDAVQEAWLRIWRRLPHLKDRAAFSGWAYSITRNVCLDRIRARDKLKADSLDAQILELAAPDHERPDTQTERRLELEQAWKRIAALPMAQREAFLLVAVHGLSYEEAALAMGTAPSTLRGRLARARAALSHDPGEEGRS